ncbi:tetratricopeptide repeat protein [Alteromonas facilis]|uniref:tetratricopeptide repeat protein n=1 Tax=Alteromonas facilis TaxID=2048004 RepID=UPI000C28E127|nr:tetratricopeptide repeat protein [Alteromonas facilis]
MRVVKSVALAALFVGLTGCVSTPPEPLESANVLLNDKAFPGYHLFDVETEEEVFTLPPEARAFVERVTWPHDHPSKKIKALVSSVFDRSDFNLLYSNDANTTAAQTFRNKAANCLSMSIMTYALARYAGFDARFQDIQIPEYWTRRDGFSLLNGHVNVLVRPRHDQNVIQLLSNDMVIDFDPQDSRKHFPVVEISKRQALAMFYNNKGADALISDSYSQAYAYFRAAVEQDPDFDAVWVNLGILYRRTGSPDLAQKVYERAIQADDDNLTAWENLAFLHQQNGNIALADEIFTRVERRRQDNPFYHFILGEQAFDDGDLEGALLHYVKAHRLDAEKHEILFGLSKTYYELGDISRAEKYLAMAKRRAPNPVEEARYEGKLSKLQRL